MAGSWRRRQPSRSTASEARSTSSRSIRRPVRCSFVEVKSTIPMCRRRSLGSTTRPGWRPEIARRSRLARAGPSLAGLSCPETGPTPTRRGHGATFRAALPAAHRRAAAVGGTPHGAIAGILLWRVALKPGSRHRISRARRYRVRLVFRRLADTKPRSNTRQVRIRRNRRCRRIGSVAESEAPPESEAAADGCSRARPTIRHRATPGQVADAARDTLPESGFRPPLYSPRPSLAGAGVPLTGLAGRARAVATGGGSFGG